MRFLLNKGYSPNTIGSRIKNLKVFMGEAMERGLTDNTHFKSSRFKKPYEKSESIYLTLDEIKAIYELDLSENTRLEKVRDLFIIGCYTGLRFSDLEQLCTDNLIDNKTKIKIKTVKTGEVVVIPLHKHVREILEKHDGIPPQLISNQKMNDYLKEIGEKAGITDAVIINTTKGMIKESATYNKFELITSHTARRSFATNAYLNDIPSISIMKITGHSTEKAFLTYIKISQEDNANKLLNHPFFN
jgi:integrase